MKKALKNHINCSGEMLNAIQERKCCSRYVIIPWRNTIPFQELIGDHCKRQMYITILSHGYLITHDFSLKFQRPNITPSIASGVHVRDTTNILLIGHELNPKNWHTSEHEENRNKILTLK